MRAYMAGLSRGEDAPRYRPLRYYRPLPLQPYDCRYLILRYYAVECGGQEVSRALIDEGH